MVFTLLLLCSNLFQCSVQTFQRRPHPLNRTRDVSGPAQTVADVELLPRHDRLISLVERKLWFLIIFFNYFHLEICLPHLFVGSLLTRRNRFMHLWPLRGSCCWGEWVFLTCFLHTSGFIVDLDFLTDGGLNFRALRLLVVLQLSHDLDVIWVDLL